jgi:antitoxin component of RelBE/YafQ-DinJ toxin-antitoxin module
MPKIIQVKFRADEDLKAKAEKIFEAQGTSFQEGMTRLMQTLVDSDEGLHPVLLRQVRGAGLVELLKGLTKRGKAPRKSSGRSAIDGINQ